MRKKRALMDPRTAAETRHRQRSLDAVAGRIEALKRVKIWRLVIRELFGKSRTRAEAFLDEIRAGVLSEWEGAR